jgi:hypothetical protein
LDPAGVLKTHDSYTFFDALDKAGLPHLIKTGATGTNANDILIALAYQLPCALQNATKAARAGMLCDGCTQAFAGFSALDQMWGTTTRRCTCPNHGQRWLHDSTLMESMGRLQASDLHIKVGVPPCYRINGVLRPVQGPPLSAEEADHIVDPIFPEKLKARYESDGAVDFAAFIGEDRFRCNLYRSGGHVNLAIRRVKSDIPTYEALRLPSIYNDIVEKTNEGMVLVCGVTGSGKSTTLAAMIEHINKIEACNIISIEDPVEYRFSRARAS